MSSHRSPVRIVVGIAVAAISLTSAPPAIASGADQPAQFPRQDAGTDDGASSIVAPGDSGESVSWWQERLNEWLRLTGDDLYPIVVDGGFGPQTETATRVFQRASDAVGNDGDVGPADRVALENAITALQQTGAPAGDTPPAPVDDGADADADGGSDQTVVWWQESLNEWLRLAGSDSYPIEVDGEFGAQTEAATRLFQGAFDAIADDGVVDPIDRVALEDSIAALQSGARSPLAVDESEGDSDQTTSPDDDSDDDIDDDGDDGGDDDAGSTDGDSGDGEGNGDESDDSESELVSWWQERLNDWGLLAARSMFPIVIDGDFGPQTEAATRDFQRAFEALDDDGTVDPIDRVALDDAIDALESGTAEPVLSPDSTGEQVGWWQERLNEWLRLTESDTYPIVIDGEFGPQTETATREFQRASAAVPNDGTVDPPDRVALEAAITALT